MASLTSLGIGSGLDTAGMLEALKVSEQMRLKPYTNLQASYEAKISAWGQISSSLDALNKSVKTLQVDAFNTLSVSNNKAFTATATSGAYADTHDVTVTQLAASHKLKTEAVPSADAAQGSKTDDNNRTLIITQKDGSEMRVELKDDETSLHQIAKAINKEDGDVSASVQRSDDGYQLVLSSKNTGVDGEMSVRVEGDDTLDDFLHVEDGGKHVDEDGNLIPGGRGGNDRMTAVADAQDAKLRVDGSNYTRPSNNINDILTGVTLELKAVSEEGKSEKLTLTQDTSQVKTSIKDFVAQYNALMTQTNSASKYVPNDSVGLGDSGVQTPNPENGALMGDSMLRGMVNDIKYTVNGVYGDSNAQYSSLADIGIKIDSSTGMMTLDEAKLDEAIATNPDDVANIFMDRNGNEGLASKLSGIITNFTGDAENKIDGSIKATTDSLNGQVDVVKIQIEKTQALIDAQVERYRVQFQNLDKTMAQLNSVSNQLGALISTL
ncbi:MULTISPECIES: flagellar filament capping protein FliD [Yersinia]|uniref:Flagellar hook-associated protein 2 n=1 Tax=Yersinia intermedia TaxID=631 RepID=A0A0H5M0W1_YERIN|nr:MULTISPECIES: flagellar filament capping protein FliD [Yersinia]MCB5309553.1 flagellar filament capping protein FliD [Yersinia massiliensis]CRY56960.1 flagellar capping protein [Yersinia intermedia]